MGSRRSFTKDWAEMEVDVARAVKEWTNIKVDVAKVVKEWANIKVRKTRR